MTIIHYDRSLRTPFQEMLVAYFSEIQSNIPDDIIRGKLLELIEKMYYEHTIHVAIPFSEAVPCGFSIYQIDTVQSDWCKRPGWGFIREFYITPPLRRRGIGKALSEYTEKHLRQLGATQLYLTADHVTAFWEKCGFYNTLETCSNDLQIMTK